MADRIQIRRDTAANWTAANPTLAQGEYGLETDTSFIKIGDGSTAWNSLGYIGGELADIIAAAAAKSTPADADSFGIVDSAAGNALKELTFSDLWAWIRGKHESTLHKRVASSSVPVGILPSGTIGNNGALTLGTALPKTYSNGLYSWFPANAISAGSAEGFYWVVMSSTTAGTIYNNTYDPATWDAATDGPVQRPASPTAFSTTGPGAYTQTTSQKDLLNVTLSAGSLGPNGLLTVRHLWGLAHSASNKTLKFKIAGVDAFTDAINSGGSNHQYGLYANSDSESIQVGSNAQANNVFGGNGRATSQFSANTSSDVVLSFAASMAGAAEAILLEVAVINVDYGA